MVYCQVKYAAQSFLYTGEANYGPLALRSRPASCGSIRCSEGTPHYGRICTGYEQSSET